MLRESSFVDCAEQVWTAEMLMVGIQLQWVTDAPRLEEPGDTARLHGSCPGEVRAQGSGMHKTASHTTPL